MTNPDKNGSNLVIPVVAALLFVAVAATLVWYTQVRPFIRPAVAVVPPSAAGGAAEAVVPTAPVDMDAVIAAINKGGCVACHTIPDIPGANGQVGPDLANIGVDGATRIAGYSAANYIHESLAEPSAFTAPDCPFGPCITGTMPTLALDEAEIELLVSFLSTLGVAQAD